MTGGAAKMGILGGYIGSLFGEDDKTRLKACHKKIDFMNDDEVQKIVKGNFAGTLLELENRGRYLTGEITIRENYNEDFDQVLQEEIASFRNNLRGILKEE